MSQIFGRHFDLVLRLTLLGAVTFAIGLVVIWRVAIAPAIGAAIEQPVPFSHKHHVGEVGLDCRYCHASVETSAYAGMPDSSTCMNCHSQLYADAPVLEPVRASVRDGKPLHWQRIYRLPDFVFFDHSIHVGRGIGCAACHGDVARMPLTWQAQPLTMQWCLDCHRHPPPAAPGTVALRRTPRQLSDCSTCHR